MSILRVALFGGLYSNCLALEAAIADARRRGCDALYCLGDLGAFGPHPNRVFPLLRANRVVCVRGNYDDSIGRGLTDCQCGYTDPRDNYFAQVSYDYTLANTSDENRAWLRTLPDEIRFDRGRNRHVAFGGGIHRCLGANLGRRELVVGLQEFMHVVPEFTHEEPGEPWHGVGPLTLRIRR